VHVSRATIGYIIKRSYQEGASKAVLENLVRSNRSLRVESSYLRYLMKKSIPGRLATIYRKTSFLQLWAITLSVCATLAGYIVQKIKRLFRSGGMQNRALAEGQIE
jgi:predicted DNA-binding helix-hairpin-helix protein